MSFFSQIKATSEEMELYVWVKKTFDQLFHVQEKLKVFQVYENSKTTSTEFDWQEAFGTALKEATWVR